MWFIGVKVEQETSAPPPKKNPGSAPDYAIKTYCTDNSALNQLTVYNYFHLIDQPEIVTNKHQSSFKVIDGISQCVNRLHIQMICRFIK